MSPTGTIALAIRSALVARLHWRQSGRPGRTRPASQPAIAFAQREASACGGALARIQLIEAPAIVKSGSPGAPRLTARLGYIQNSVGG